MSSRANLLAYYSFDTDFNDSSGNANHLSITSGNPSITNAAGKTAVGGGALELVSSESDEDYLSLATPITFSEADSWSIAFWGRRGIESTNRQGMVIGDTTSSDFVWLADGGGGVQGLRYRNSAGVHYDYGGFPDDGGWHHWVLVADGVGNLTVYRDNVLLSTASRTTTLDLAAVGQAYNGAAQSFNGQIDELRVYDEAINAAAVDSLFKAGEVGEEEPPAEPPGEVDQVLVYLLGGQSNADGRGATSGLPTSPVNLQQPQEDVDFYAPLTSGQVLTLRPGASQFGPEIVLGRRLADLYSFDETVRVAVVKYAVGGTNLHTQWKAGGDGTTSGDGPVYVSFQQTVRSGLTSLTALYPTADVSVEGMLWVQGERDAKDGTESQYGANLTAFIADVRATYGEDLPFVVSRLSDLQTNIAAVPLQIVQDAQTAVADADPSTSLIDTDGFGMASDNLHFNALGAQQIGHAAAGELFAFVELPTPELCLLEGGEIEVKLSNASAGVAYTLQTTLTLETANWTDVETVMATDSEVVFLYSPPALDRRRFFRVAMSL